MVFTNNTADFYKQTDVKIENEATISHFLRKGSEFLNYDLPCYGKQLRKFLSSKNMLNEQFSILEIGAGYGDLMFSFLDGFTPKSITMLDICPYLLNKQKEKLENKKINFIEGNVFDKLRQLEKFDLVICNEVISDFPTEIDTNINIGALKFIELLAEKTRFAFISEFSFDEIKVSNQDGHDEYSIDFDMLEKTANKLGFDTELGDFYTLLSIDLNDKKQLISNPQNITEKRISVFLKRLKHFNYLLLRKC